MKTVAKCFKWGLNLGFIWLVIKALDAILWLYGRIDPYFIYTSSTPTLIMDLLDLLLITIIKVLLGIGVTLYVWYQVQKWEEEQKQVKY